MPDFGKSCCGCCPKDCQDHINLRALDRFYVYIQGVDGKKTYVHMGNNPKDAFAVHASLTNYFLALGWNQDKTPHVLIGHLEKYQTTRYESIWQRIESGQGPVTGYDPFDY